MRFAVALVAVLALSCGNDDPAPPVPRASSQQPDLLGVEGTKAFDDPAALAFAPNGDLWIGNYESSTIARYAAGTLTKSGVPRAATVIEGKDVQGPNAMVFDAHGYLWVAMQDGNRVAGFTPQDLAAGRAPTVVLPDPGSVLDEPAGVALDGEGNLWVSNSGVGHLVRYPRRGLEAGTSKPDVVLDVPDEECQGVAVHKNLLWLGCANTDRVYVYKMPTKSGRPVRHDQLNFRQPCGPVQLVAAPGGLLAAACYFNAAVALFGKNGSGGLESSRVAAQSLTNVHGIAYSPSGVLWAGSNRNVLVGNPGSGEVVLRPHE